MGAPGMHARSHILDLALTFRSRSQRGELGPDSSGGSDGLGKGWYPCTGWRRDFSILCHPGNSRGPRATRAEPTYRVNHEAEVLGD